MKPPVNPICCHHLEWIGWHLARPKREHTLPSLSLPNGSRRCSRRLAAGLKIGIHGELLALGIDRKLVVVALRSYCGSSGYLSALCEGAARIGLDGQPTGVVTAEEEKIAAAQLTGKIARATAEGAKPALEVTGAPTLASSGGPRRLSLSDLRELGRRRRA
jgi:ProQ/FINO family